jgi:hypothetical protein
MSSNQNLMEQKENANADCLQRLVRHLVAFVIAITITPTVILPCFLIGFPLAMAWTCSGNAAGDWSDRLFEGWGRILKSIRGEDA